MVNPTIEEVMVRIMKSWEHAGTDDFDRLDEVGADDVVAREPEAGDDEALKKLSKDAFGTLGFACSTVCGGFGRKRLRVGHLHVRVHFAEQRLTDGGCATRGKIT